MMCQFQKWWSQSLEQEIEGDNTSGDVVSGVEVEVDAILGVVMLSANLPLRWLNWLLCLCSRAHRFVSTLRLGL